MCILGDIFGFNVFGPFYASNSVPKKITKKKLGDQYIKRALEITNMKFFEFLIKGGINQNISGLKYSFNTLMLFATLKGLDDKKDMKKSCTDEYIKMFNKYGNKRLSQEYLANDTYIEALESISKNEPIKYDKKYNDSMVLSRVLPFGLLFWKKEERSKLITEIIENISITHKNNTCYLSAITIGLFISFKKNGINVFKWGHKLVEYLLSDEFDNIIKTNKLYSTEFMLDKEDYVSLWNTYLDNSFTDNLFNDDRAMIIPQKRANHLFLIFNDLFTNEFVYGLKSEESIIIAYDSLLYCDGYWEKMIMYGVLGITDNAVMGSICGLLFGIEYGINDSINKNRFKEESWVKKVLVLSKKI